MPTITGTAQSTATPETILPRLVLAVFGMPESVALPFTWLSGAPNARVASATSTALPSTSATASVRVAATAQSVATPTTVIDNAVAIAANAVLASGVSQADPTTSATGTLTIAASGRSDALATTTLEPVATIPQLRVPAAGEQPGTVNLVRNPSLEYDAIGLTDWSAQAGITLTRDNAAAWDGTWSALAVTSIGGGLPEVSIRSQEGLAITGSARWWIGSIALTGNALLVRLWLRPIYLDGAGPDGDTIDVVATADWQRVSTPPIATDPARVLTRIDLVGGVQQQTGAQTARFDGAQIEEATTGQATSYTDGDQGDGYAWTSTPGMSMSLREPM